ncbi:hypothetical protein AVEN_181943-1 [Araneus ventricosus]|uniref:Uncharacterized protein n=1 Tax=Araneus ventricosus TaxID=182803 RepID=A0A4Y2UQ86_ARAVE|nr:hypothetical protein AVEN_181943-1 [Araneus ventricosus]
MPKRKRGFTRDSARRQQAIRKRERRVAETHTKKETMAQRSLDRSAEETEQNNSRLSVMAQRGQDRKAEETEEKINSRLCQTWPNVAMREEPKKQKDQEIADCQPWYNMQENDV